MTLPDMTRFSERVGARAAPRRIQISEMDDELRACIWNVITPRFSDSYQTHWSKAARFLAHQIFKVPTDTVPGSEEGAYKWLRDRFFTAPWHQVYDILEALVDSVDDICRPTEYSPYYQEKQSRFISAVNALLVRELSGYRFIRGVLVPISDPAEVAAIEEAAAVTAKTGLSGAHEHIAAALRLLGQKPEPDYRNSIKESISAVECAVNIVTGSDGNGVAAAVEKLASHTEVHGALRAALKQLYGFTSDSGGIRHAILDQQSVGFHEAKFMLVTCAAFVNFIVGKAESAGLL